MDPTVGRSVANAPFRVIEGGLENKPRISVVGLGYVGAVSVACLSHLGFDMLGVDIAEDKVRCIKDGKSPIVESRLEELLSEGVERGRIDATGQLLAERPLRCNVVAYDVASGEATWIHRGPLGEGAPLPAKGPALEYLRRR